MGFYGNITNTTRTQFSFDAIYSNRLAMDSASADDNVYIGRYVLVEYDEDPPVDSYIQAYKVVNEDLVSDFVFSTTQEFSKDTVLQFGSSLSEDGVYVPKGTIIQILGDGLHNAYDSATKITEYWMCTGETTYTLIEHIVDEEDSSIITDQETLISCAKWENIGNSDEVNFTVNYNTDIKQYGISRGYDSTVWQKVLINNVEEYKMVAELNTVVPTFDIAADAPTQIPLTPHFDSNSTNVYYKLHYQPQWGFRVKSAHSMQIPTFSSAGVIQTATTDSSTQEREYPCDLKTNWIRDSYDKKSGLKTTYYATVDEGNTTVTWDTTKPDDTVIPSAIYFNKNGMDSTKVVKSDDVKFKGWPDPTSENPNPPTGYVFDEIYIEPTGLSGSSYQSHEGVEAPAVDTQELSIMLPSVGNAISDFWDLIYGGRDTNKAIEESDLRNQYIEWLDARSVQKRPGLRLVSDGYSTNENDLGIIGVSKKNYYNTAEANTLAGCINSVHDLMGMIIEKHDTLADMEANITDNLDNVIYYDAEDQKYYRKDLTYEYYPVSEYKFVEKEISEDEYVPGKYYKYDETTDSWVVADEDEYDPDTTYGYKTIDTDDTYDEQDLHDFSEANYFYSDYTTKTKKDYVLDSTYHRDKKYYTLDEEKIKGTKVSGLLDGYQSGKYWVKDSDEHFVPDSAGHYDSDQTYYEIEEDFSILDIDSDPQYDGLYLPGLFYYKAFAADYTNIDGSTSSAGDPYNLDIDEKSLYTYLIDNTTGGTGVSSNKSMVSHYAVKSSDSSILATYTPVDTYVAIDFGTDSGYVYSANTYYVETGDEKNPYALSGDTEAKSGVTYYEKQTKYVYGYQGYTIDETPLHLFPFNRTKANVKRTDSTTKEVTTEEVTLGPWYLKQKVTYVSGYEYYIYIKAEAASVRQYLYDFYINKSEENSEEQLVYYQLNISSLSDFYEPDRYYYYTEAGYPTYPGSYILEDTDTMTIKDSPTVDYTSCHYLIDAAKDVHEVNYKFYEPSYYYKKDEDGNYVISDDETPQEDETYFKRYQYYVDSDSSGILKRGMLWNQNVVEIPPSVTLAQREETYTYYELKEFARKLNTIHGMLLKINQVLDSEDENTRDTNTVQGALNTVNDILAQIGEFNPENIMVTDNYGRIHGATFTTNQDGGSLDTTTNGNKQTTYGIKSDIYPNVDSVDDMTEQWITLNVDGDPNQPKVTIHHNFQSVTDTTTQANKNKADEDTKVTITTAGENNSVGDSIKLYSPIVDKMGHIVGKNTETVTLPYGFKTISTNGRSTTDSGDNTTDPSHSNIVADNTQDTLTINSGNKWIKIETDVNTDTITVSHDIHTPTVSKKDDSDINGNGDTITIQDIVFDNAGHMTENRNHTYTLPYGYKTFQDSETSANKSIASSTQDTFTFKGDSWISPIVSEDQLTLTHTGPVTTAHTTVSNVTPKFGDTFSITDWDFDTKGHKANSDSHTVTIPQGSLTETTAKTDSNVLTSIAFTQDTGAITVDRTNLGALQLGTYTPAGTVTVKTGETIAATSALTTTATLSTALSALDARIMNTEKTIALLDVDDTAVDGQYISEIDQTNGEISVSRTNFSPSVTLTDGTASNAPKVNITINTKSATAQELSKASTSIYGATKLSSDIDSEDETLAATPKAVKEAYDLADGKQDPETTIEGYGIEDAKIEDGVITLGEETITPITADTKFVYSDEDDFEIGDIYIEPDSADDDSSSTAPSETITIVDLITKINNLEAKLAAYEKANGEITI